jgi:hypothetical protein
MHSISTWLQRLKGVFNLVIETCNNCEGNVEIIVCIEDPQVIEKIPIHIERKDTSTIPSGLPPSQGPPQVSLFDRDCTHPP